MSESQRECQCVSESVHEVTYTHTTSPFRFNSLFLYLIGLRVLQSLGLVNIQEEILQQDFTLCQVVCCVFLVDQGQILPIALCVLE